MKKHLLLFSYFLLTISVKAQSTWSSDVANIIYTKCSNCHNPNGIAPFSIMNYQDAVDNSSDIQSAVEDHVMPPWPPDPNYNHLAYERVLSPNEISAISDWVNNGTPRGDSTLEPPSPVFTGNSEMTNPTLTLSAPVYNVNTTTDLYRCFVLPTGQTTQQYITGLEAIPGNRSVVHHILIYSDTSATPLQLDAADPDPGYTNFGGTGSNTSKLIGVWVPGQRAYFTPDNMGIKLLPNANIILQIHYPGGISNVIDSTKINLQLSSSFHRELYIDAPLNHYQLDQGWLSIAPNTTPTFTAHYVIPYDISALAVGPHMHLLGKSVRSYGVTPMSDTIPFIDIPQWDFHWQGVYSFPRIIKLPQGTTIYSSAQYDNTTNNPENPNDPPQWVFLGEGTTDEMMLIYFAYTFYFPGDENTIIDSALVAGISQPISNSAISTPQLYEPSPNPVVNSTTVQYFLPANAKSVLRVTDINGRIVKVIEHESMQGLITQQVDMQELATGTYVLELISGNVVRSKKLIKQ